MSDIKLNKIKYLLVVEFLFLAPAAMAYPKVTENYHYYTIEPKNSEDLRAALDRATPINENGKISHAATHWDLHWTFKFWTGGDGTCAVQEVNTILGVDYTLPQLANTVKDKKTLEEFQHYFLALREHEHGHAKNGSDAANEVEKSLTGLSAPSCNATETLANEKGKEILRQYNQRDIDYDNKIPEAAP